MKSSSPGRKDKLADLVETNQRLEKEQAQARAIIEDLRGLVESFQAQLDETKQMHAATLPEIPNASADQYIADLEEELRFTRAEADKFRRESMVLNRALAVTARDSGADGEFLLRQAEESLQVERLMIDVKRMDELEVELEHAYKKLETADLQLKYDQELRSAVTALRVQNDELTQTLEAAESRHASTSEERDRYRRRCDELESIIARVHAEQREDRENATERIKQLTRVIGQLEHDMTGLDGREKTAKQRIVELEQVIIQRDARVRDQASEIATLRTAVQDLDNEIRNLATSLAAETEANENLSVRLERVEAEKLRVEHENYALRRKDKDLAEHVKELGRVKAENEGLKKSLYMLQSSVHERDLRITGLEQSRTVIRESMSLEIDRLNSELSHMASTSASLSERFLSVSKEKDKFKSLLASDTMTRLAPLLDRTHRQA